MKSSEEYQLEIAQWCAQHKPTHTYQYQVPVLGEGGTCSLFGELDPIPFDLEQELTVPQLQLVPEVQKLVDWVQQHTKVDWFGVYLARENNKQEKVLTKLAYFGAPSRAEFPLTAQFAQISNNTAVGISGEKRTINDVEQYMKDGGEYYTCDPKVKSELCWPITTSKSIDTVEHTNSILGIIDAECFFVNSFDIQTQQIFDAVCAQLTDIIINPNNI